jgi:hypothetical protein
MVRRPLPRRETLSASHGAATLLDVARWAESCGISGTMRMQASLAGPDDVLFAPGGTAEKQVRSASAYINELSRLVGTSHASVTTLRLHRLTVALRGAYARAWPCPREELAAEVRRLLGVRAGTAAAATPASTLLAHETASLAATLRRAKRLAALKPMPLCHLACVLAGLGGFEDEKIARCVVVHIDLMCIASHPCRRRPARAVGPPAFLPRR